MILIANLNVKLPHSPLIHPVSNSHGCKQTTIDHWRIQNLNNNKMSLTEFLLAKNSASKSTKYIYVSGRMDIYGRNSENAFHLSFNNCKTFKCLYKKNPATICTETKKKNLDKKLREEIDKVYYRGATAPKNVGVTVMTDKVSQKVKNLENLTVLAGILLKLMGA